MRGNVCISLIGLENQTERDKPMPMRNFSYDGGSYKEQVLQYETLKRKHETNKWKPYPAVTIVLYFGNTHWYGPRTLRSMFPKDLPPEIEEMIPDYKLNLYEISFLTPEQVAMFKSDFKIVADYFVQTRTNKDYVPTETTIRHVDETLKLLSALTGDNRFEEKINEMIGKGDSVRMSDVLNVIEQRGLARGLAEGRAEGRAEGEIRGKILTLAKLVLKGRLTLTEAASEINLSEEEFSRKMEEFKQEI